jgi:hypothetical protein
MSLPYNQLSIGFVQNQTLGTFDQALGGGWLERKGVATP